MPPSLPPASDPVMPRLLLGASAAALFALVTFAVPDVPPPPYNPAVAKASDDYKKALAAIKVPKGFTVALWAAEPMLANPVVFHMDHKGRVFVAETFRLHAGVSDIRGYLGKQNYWLDDDLACR